MSGTGAGYSLTTWNALLVLCKEKPFRVESGPFPSYAQFELNEFDKRGQLLFQPFKWEPVTRVDIRGRMYH